MAEFMGEDANMNHAVSVAVERRHDHVVVDLDLGGASGHRVVGFEFADAPARNGPAMRPDVAIHGPSLAAAFAAAFGMHKGHEVGKAVVIA